MNLTELSKSIRFDNASKGFDPTEGGIDRYLLLAISEICEAQEELRDGRDVNYVYYQPQHPPGEVDMDLPHKPCGFPVEIADAIIRLLDIAGKFDIEVKLGDFTSYRFDEPIDFYLLRTCHTIAEAQYGTFAGLQTYKFQHSIVTAITALVHLCRYYKIDIITVIHEKLAFNRNRPPKHGRKF